MKASELSFGVEMECYIPLEYREFFPVGHYHRGYQIRVAPAGWNTQHDGSVICYDHRYIGAEVVSPILRGEDGLCQIWYMADLLQQVGAKVDSHCGLHVHVDARHLTRAQVRQVMRAFTKYEKAFFGLSGAMGNDRWNSRYCKPSHRWLNPTDDRYQSLNVTNFERYETKKTIEFRVWAGTLDCVLIMAAVSMAVTLVARAADCPDEGDQIAEPLAAAKAFSRNYLCKAKIVEDCTITELTRVLYRQAKQCQLA